MFVLCKIIISSMRLIALKLQEKQHDASEGAFIMVNEKITKVGARIKYLRLVKQLSQKTAAEKIGISQASLSNIECGRSHCTLENIIKLSEVLQCPVSDFFVDIDGEQQKPRQEQGLFSLNDFANALLSMKK